MRYAPPKPEKVGNPIITLHREENVDDKAVLEFLLLQIRRILTSIGLSGEFLIHPRTAKRIQEYGLQHLVEKPLMARDVLRYRETLIKIATAPFIITDSGGLQEEACILKTPCYTLRKTTERPETIDCGANVLLGIDDPFSTFVASYSGELTGSWVSPFGDGTAGYKIAKVCKEWIEVTER